jgi:hypothetical protein
MSTLASLRSLFSTTLLTLVALTATASGFAAEEDASPLPLKKVVLFSSSVGYFEHLGQVEGNQKVEMKFNIENINDLLKSMVLQDAGGGRIATVTYGSQDPISRTLKTFAIDLTRRPSLADLLSQIRGHRVQVETPSTIVGVVVGVERRRVQVGTDQVLDVEVLNLKTATGLRSVPLSNIAETRLLDEKLDREFQQALDLLASAHSADKKTVTLDCRGQGQRPVRVGYIQEFPIWKTSYRLVLKDGEAPFLQGWAIVENTTEQDWTDVQLTLVSGRPISFVMDLYQPLYLERPLVVPELFASLRPRTYDQDLAEREEDFRALAGTTGKPIRRPEQSAGMGGFGGGFAGGGGFGGPGRPAVTSVVPAMDTALDLQQGVASVAGAEDVGELFRYVIQTPVSLPRQQSAMLPIVNDSVKGEKVSIYNPEVHGKHPLNGLKMTNSTDLHLMQGPITVFDGGEYAGDARIDDLQPGTERLISYALDLDTEVAQQRTNEVQQLVSVRIAKGTLMTSHKLTRTNEYVVKNSGSSAKKVLIEQPPDTPWELVSPKEPAEKTRGLYRFAVQAEPGKPTTLIVAEEQVIQQKVAVTSISNDDVVIYLNAKVVSPVVKAAIGEVVQRKQALANVATHRAQLEQQISEIDREQARIRQNMAQLERTSELYVRYVKKFTDQEGQIETLREQIAKLKADETEKRMALDTFLLELDVQ